MCLSRRVGALSSGGFPLDVMKLTTAFALASLWVSSLVG